MREAYLEAADRATGLLADPAVAAAWDQPSALAGMRVGSLAAHLARQIVYVPGLLALDVPDGEAIALIEHYGRALWLGADLDNDANTGIRADAELDAAVGFEALAEKVRTTLGELRTGLAAQPDDRRVFLPWGPWSLSLDDFLSTRTLELVVHGDDLAVSVGVPTPSFPPSVLDPVLHLLTQMSVRRHGYTAVLRGLSRAERAPESISAL